MPSCIEERREGRGGLWHGGFKSVVNREFLEREGITHIVNTALGLEVFGPRYTVSQSVFPEFGRAELSKHTLFVASDSAKHEHSLCGI